MRSQSFSGYPDTLGRQSVCDTPCDVTVTVTSVVRKRKFIGHHWWSDDDFEFSDFIIILLALLCLLARGRGGLQHCKPASTSPVPVAR